MSLQGGLALGAGGALLPKKVDKFLFGGKDKIKKAGTLTPDQEQLMALITEGLTKGDGALKGLFGDFNKEEFDQGVTQPALKNFQENILPMLNEKFIGNNQVGGSGMQRAQMKAGTDLQSQLAQLMYQAQNQQQQNKMGGLQTALGTRGFENIYKQGNTGAVQSLLQGAGQGLGKMATAAIAG